jgi:hypothetical protein
VSIHSVFASEVEVLFLDDDFDDYEGGIATSRSVVLNMSKQAVFTEQILEDGTEYVMCHLFIY